MAGIYGPSGADSAPRIDRAKRVQRIQRAQAPAPVNPNREADRAEISNEARLLAQLANMPAVRNERVEAARNLVDDNAFNLDESFRKAMHKLLLEEFGA
ncbi:MAG: flagellar biosynthesis anti-sigma factor FlgM [Planctomycetes bacterium]|nr:flagellar biosynthesis anti-sigma factor FlgM [Planctomycetota bacterium]